MKFDFTDGEWESIVNKDGWYIKSNNHNSENVMICMSKIYPVCILRVLHSSPEK